MQIAFAALPCLVPLLAFAAFSHSVLAQADLRPSLSTPRSTPLSEKHRRRTAYYQSFMPAYEEKARRQLESYPGALRARAEASLRGSGNYFDLQRVEITGIRAGEDGSDDWAGTFDYQVALSFFSDRPKPQGLLERAWKAFKDETTFPEARDTYRDLSEAMIDRTGEISARARERLRPLGGASINEIWAHSWGADAIYAAIVDGLVRPPRRLFVLGVPSRNLEKWEVMAKFTGTEILIFGYDTDAVSRIVSRVPVILTRDRTQLEGRWSNWCRANQSRCLESIGIGAGFATAAFEVPARDVLLHRRADYYRYLSDRGLFLTPVADMRREQERLLSIEEHKLVRKLADRLWTQDPPPPHDEGMPRARASSPFSTRLPPGNAATAPGTVVGPVWRQSPPPCTEDGVTPRSCVPK